MALPALRQRKPVDTGRDRRDRCPGHLAWVRKHECSVSQHGGCDGAIEAAHVRRGTDAGIGLKPSDNWSVSLCHTHHAEQHRIGEPAFEAKYSINLKQLAAEFTKASPAWKRYLAKKEQGR